MYGLNGKQVGSAARHIVERSFTVVNTQSQSAG